MVLADLPGACLFRGLQLAEYTLKNGPLSSVQNQWTRLVVKMESGNFVAYAYLSCCTFVYVDESVTSIFVRVHDIKVQSPGKLLYSFPWTLIVAV